MIPVNTDTAVETAQAPQPAQAAAQPEKKKTRRFQRPKHLVRWIIVAVVIAAAAFAAYKFFSNAPMQNVDMPTYIEEEAMRRTITRSLTGSGTLKPANSYTVTTLVQGEILASDFEEGDVVEKDTVLYRIDSSDAESNIERAEIALSQARRSYDSTADNRYVRANSSGTLFSLEVEAGDEVQAGQTVATIRDDATMILVVPFPADDAVTFSKGQAASVTLDGSFEVLPSTVKSISGSNIVGVGNTITRNVTIAVPNPGGIALKQLATASINGIGCAGSGEFAYQSESTVTASASGTVTAVNASEGSTVSKNQAILTLGGDDLEDQLQIAADSLRSAELSMENTREQLDSYTVKSPIGGTVIEKNYKAGDTIESGKTLCVIYDMSYLEMTINVDELDIGLVSAGQSVTITAGAVPDGFFEGVITKVSVAGNTEGGVTAYPVTVRIDEPGTLLPGMNVDAEIVVANADDALSVPAGAVMRGAGGASVVMITASSPSAVNAVGGEAPEGYVYVEVTTGISDDNYIQILSGLTEGDTVAYIARSAVSGAGDEMYYYDGPYYY